MPEKKFLQQIADYYIAKEKDLSNLTMVFPNRRSAMFMRQYMHEAMKKIGFMPRMISITYFTQQFNKTTLASTNELVFLLYKVYCKVLTKHDKADQIPDFDNFFFWGSILLNDFNEVDAYLADAADLFTNIKRIKEIKAHYLTDEQKEVIEYLWGERLPTDDDGIFWDHVRHGEEEKPSSKFLNLWEILYELYTEFKTVLLSQDPPLAYSGMQSRYACEKIKKMGKEEFRDQRYAFIGFNVLSLARINIFKRLQSLGIAEFFWDIASPYLVNADGSPSAAGRHIIPLSRRFCPPSDFELIELNDNRNDIEIISVPSNVGQTKVANAIIEKWSEEWTKDSDSGKVDEKHLINTAIVMADENLLTPMLYSIPDKIPTINVTMGVSYRSTPFSALMSAIISMHLRAYKIRGIFHYFYQDVIDVVAHPHIIRIAPSNAEDIKNRIMKEHLFNISAERIMSDYPELAFLFRPITEENNIDDVKTYIEGLIVNLTEKLHKTVGHKTAKDFYELDILQGYAEEVRELCSMMKKYSIKVREHTFLQMIERTLQNRPINFAGEPLKGMQLMGVMDTRALDFDNIIMLSLNERIFPKRSYSPSLISMNLRNSYGLPTQEHEESTYAYQFYRLISRASHVRLLYDSRTSGISSGERSRYLSQLVYLHKESNVRTHNVELSAEKEEVGEIIINKTPKVMLELNEFFPGGKLKFSASAFKTYFQCPVKFYFEYVRNLRIYEETVDYIDAASFGTVTHRVVQELYKPYAPADFSANRPVTASDIDAMIHSDIELLAMKILDKEYYHDRYSARLDRIPGEGKVISMLIAKYVRKMLEIEKKWTELHPFTFLANEYCDKKIFHWPVTKKYTINFRMSIDRVDRIRSGKNPTEEELRFIDFKTGDDDLSCMDMDGMLKNHKKSAIFQLLLYCYAYADLFNYKGKIKPLIYKFQTIATEGIPDLSINKKKITDYRQADDIGFMDRFREKVEEIFNPDIPFTQTNDSKNCKYCAFKQICGRYPEDRGF